MFQPLTTARLVIRQAKPGDGDALHRRRNDPEVAAHQHWALPFPLERARAIVEGAAAMKGPAEDDWWMATVTLPNGEILGDLAVRIEWQGRVAVLGYTFGSEHWGQGYATEAAGAMVDWLFEDFGVSRVSAMTHPDNVPSAMVLERLGFRYEGWTRLSYWLGEDGSDDWLFGMVRDDWETWRTRPLERPQAVELVEVTAENASSVYRLETNKTQERFVATMAHSFADALIPMMWNGAPLVPWMRAVEADQEIAAFVMLALSNEFHPEPLLWRLLVDRMHQRRGIGKRVLDLVADECRAMGDKTLLTSWEEGRGSPREFYLSYGFEPTGEILEGETVGRLEL